MRFGFFQAKTLTQMTSKGFLGRRCCWQSTWLCLRRLWVGLDRTTITVWVSHMVTCNATTKSKGNGNGKGLNKLKKHLACRCLGLSVSCLGFRSALFVSCQSLWCYWVHNSNNNTSKYFNNAQLPQLAEGVDRRFPLVAAPTTSAAWFTLGIASPRYCFHSPR